MGEVYGDHAMSLDQLRWYSDSVMEKNPNSCINLEFHQQTGRFVRYFISFRACIDGFNHCRPLHFLDETLLKGRFKRNLLTATAKDGNKGLFPVAFAIVDSENQQNWEWFLWNLKKVVGDRRGNVTVRCDRVQLNHLTTRYGRPVIFQLLEKKLVTTYNDSRAWSVSQVNDNVYEVHSLPSVLVDVTRRSCSCFQWQLNGFPCSHAVIAFRNRERNIYDSIERYYHIDKFQASYSRTIYPIPTIKKLTFMPNDFMIAPPKVKRPPGRPKRKRIPSKGEVVQRIRCGRCGKIGNHNRKTCKEPI
ncbi:hypothetical protein ACSBR2_016859 [Camellia fascicularis]